jgi:hypothetical protein
VIHYIVVTSSKNGTKAYNAHFVSHLISLQDVVKAIESVGSQSGRTSAPVMIAASGQL